MDAAFPRNLYIAETTLLKEHFSAGLKSSLQCLWTTTATNTNFELKSVKQNEYSDRRSVEPANLELCLRTRLHIEMDYMP